MNTRTREALEASIRHWENNVYAKSPHQASVKEEDCALCREFIRYNCSGCPVSGKAGQNFCKGTPYILAVKPLRHWRDGDEDAEQQFRLAAQEELDFLRSLSPPIQRSPSNAYSIRTTHLRRTGKESGE